MTAERLEYAEASAGVPGTRTIGMGVCPVCERAVRLTPSRGRVRTHRSKGVRCDGTGRLPAEPLAPLVLTGLADPVADIAREITDEVAGEVEVATVSLAGEPDVVAPLRSPLGRLLVPASLDADRPAPLPPAQYPQPSRRLHPGSTRLLDALLVLLAVVVAVLCLLALGG